MELKNVLRELCEADGMCGIEEALNVAQKYLSEFFPVRRSGNSLVASADNGCKRTVMLEAHIDQIGMMVISVGDDGFIKVAAAGGIDSRTLAAARVTVYGKEIIRGVFCSVPPHLSNGESKPQKLEDMYIDTGLKARAAELITPGDRVVFEQSFAELSGGRVTAKSLDNRAGVASLIRAAELISGKKLDCNVIFLLSDMEELGGDGAKTESYSLNPDEAVAVDVSFGNEPDISEYKTGKLGNGTMIGVSPVLSQEVTDRLINVAKTSEIKYQTEVMGGRTSTDADVISVTRSGVKCGLLSVPLRNMHTPVEIVDLADVESTARILAGFICSTEESR